MPDLTGQPICRPAGAYGPYRRGPVASSWCSGLDPAGVERIDVLCARPLHHALEFSALHGRLRELRLQAPQAEIALWLCSALPDDEVFASLPADRIGRLPVDPGGANGLLDRLGRRGGACVLLGGGEEDASLLRSRHGLYLLGAPPLDFVACPPDDADCAKAARGFHAALAAASPRWLLAPEAGVPTKPRHLLVHQSRFRVGDALWLTPLLRAIRRRFPAAAVTLVAGPLAAPVLARSPHVSDFVIWDPETGEEGRRQVRERLAATRFDAVLFALARRDKSRWLAEAMADRGVPCRVNLEYFDAAGDGRELCELFTHEAWFFWGTLASPELLLHALDPWGGGVRPGDRGVELPVSAAERREAARVLAASGVGERPFIVLAPAGHSSDRWPAQCFAELGVRLAEDWECRVLIEGAPTDEPLLRDVERCMARLRGGRPLPTWIGTDPLGVLAALLERATLLVSNDSAPIHVAEAAGAPVLYFAHHEKLVHSHPADDASWALYDEERNRLADITVEQALGAIRDMASRGLTQRDRSVEFL